MYLFQEQCEILVVIECPPNSFSFLHRSKSWKKKTKSLILQHEKLLFQKESKLRLYHLFVLQSKPT